MPAWGWSPTDAVPTRLPGRVAVADFVENVDDLLPRVKPAGGKVHRTAKDMPWGHRVAHITDPDGNPINLTQQL